MGNILFEWGMKCTFLMSKYFLVVFMQNMLTWMIKETRASIGLKGLLHNFEFQSQHSRPYYAKKKDRKMLHKCWQWMDKPEASQRMNLGECAFDELGSPKQVGGVAYSSNACLFQLLLIKSLNWEKLVHNAMQLSRLADWRYYPVCYIAVGS